MPSMPFDRSRRRFCGGCASAAALATGLPRLLRSAPGHVTGYRRVRLVDRQGEPLRSDRLETGVNYVFAYPYVSTPCFLLDLGQPITAPVELQTRDDRPYVWRGGVGPGRSIVAFSAICSHRMTHPAPGVSFISYHRGERQGSTGNGVIHCCSENSVYDPAAGARVLAGPAPEPLAAVDLEFDPDTGELTATGTTGADLFQRFLERFGDRLALDYGAPDYRRMVDGRTEVVTLEEFSRVRMQC